MNILRKLQKRECQEYSVRRWGMRSGSGNEHVNYDVDMMEKKLKLR